MSLTPAECIRQRRQQMLIHSHLYYRMDAPIISDDQWQRWADELAQLQHQHPAPVGFYDREFADWDGSTGMHLPNDGWVIEKADLVRRLHAGDHLRPDAEKTPPAPATQAPALFSAPRKKAAAPVEASQFSLF